MLVPPQSQPIETQISDVTVYEDRALVTRRGTISIERLCDIPSDGTPHKNTILNAEYPCRITHIAIPKLVSFAYLQAIAAVLPMPIGYGLRI
jgi:hypothetical protein